MITMTDAQMLQAEASGHARVYHNQAYTVDGQWRWSRRIRRWILV